MHLYAIEKREPGGEWEIHTYAPSTDLKKIADGLPACAKNTDKEWRVAEYVRAEAPIESLSYIQVETARGWDTMTAASTPEGIERCVFETREVFFSRRCRVIESATRVVALYEPKEAPRG